MKTRQCREKKGKKCDGIVWSQKATQTHNYGVTSPDRPTPMTNRFDAFLTEGTRLSHVSFGCLHVCVSTHISVRRSDLVNMVNYCSDRMVPRNNYAKWIRQSTAIWNNPGCYGIDASHVIIKYFWRILITYFIPLTGFKFRDLSGHALFYNITGLLKYIIL